MRSGNGGMIPSCLTRSADAVPEGDAGLTAGRLQTGEKFATVFAHVVAGPAADLSPLDETPDVPFAAVDIQDEIGAFEDQQLLGLMGMQPRKSPVRGS